jgi:hypothetical protein
MSQASVRSAIWVWGRALDLFLLVTCLLYIGFGFVVPGRFQLAEAWAPLLAGFEWLTLQGFLAGAADSLLYGWYVAVILVPLYNYFGRKAA